MTNTHVVIILASGLSLRLGRSKQLLSKDNQFLIHYMLKLALATKPQAIFIVIPQHQPKITLTITELIAENPIIHLVLNSAPETGMAYSLSLAIDALDHLDINASIQRVLIMGVDQVLLDNPHLNKLLIGQPSVVASSYPHLNKDFTIDSSKPNIIGLPITIDYELLKQWQLALTGDKGLRHLIRALPAEQVRAVIQHELSYDIDTPEQFVYAQQQGWLDS